MTLQPGFTPIRRTAKQRGHFEYIYDRQAKRHVAVMVQQPRFTEHFSKTAMALR